MKRKTIASGLGLASFVLYVLTLVALPLLAVISVAFEEGLDEFQRVLAGDTAMAALKLTLVTSAVVGVLNLTLGTLTAWVLVQYRFVGRALISSVIDLPLALPTLVAGVLIALLYGPSSSVGAWLLASDLHVLYTPTAIVLALAFVTLPFVVRAVEPVLHETDPAEVEAARMLGAGPFKVFMTVHFPAIFPVAVSSATRSVGRALGEFGSIIVVSGNIPQKTLTAPAYIFGEIEGGAPLNAAVLSTMLFACALLLYGASYALSRKLGTV